MAKPNQLQAHVYEEMSLWLVGKATEVSGMRPVYIETVMDDLRTGS